MNSLQAAFSIRFGRPSAFEVAAHGRVNLIGEHTDYNGGFVLPSAIPQTTHVAWADRDDGRVNVASDSADKGQVSSFELGRESKRGSWLDYVQGVTFSLAKRGTKLTKGCDIFLSSNVPLGSGLSSSAALTVALTRAFRQAGQLELSDVDVALVAHRAEHDFVGVPVGVMDPMACSLCETRSALFLDTRSLLFEKIAIPTEVDVLVIESGVPHRNATSEYRTRKAECELAAGLLGVAQLRDVTEADFGRIRALPAPLDRRARHVISENARVLSAVAAMRARDVARLGNLFNESHVSMRDDYEVSVPAIDRLVACAREQEAVLGARLTGGGFGGSIVVLVRKGHARKVGESTLSAYAARGPERATIISYGEGS